VPSLLQKIPITTRGGEGARSSVNTFYIGGGASDRRKKPFLSWIKFGEKKRQKAVFSCCPGNARRRGISPESCCYYVALSAHKKKNRLDARGKGGRGNGTNSGARGKGGRFPEREGLAVRTPEKGRGADAMLFHGSQREGGGTGYTTLLKKHKKGGGTYQKEGKRGGESHYSFLKPDSESLCKKRDSMRKSQYGALGTKKAG